jgi:hypothetical protein
VQVLRGCSEDHIQRFANRLVVGDESGFTNFHFSSSHFLARVPGAGLTRREVTSFSQAFTVSSISSTTRG